MVTLCRCDKADFAVLVSVVVPLHELLHPLTGFPQRGKAFARPGGGIFEGAEEGFHVGVVDD